MNSIENQVAFPENQNSGLANLIPNASNVENTNTQDFVVNYKYYIDPHNQVTNPLS